ncbi:Alkali-sensitive linkage protein 1-like protein 2 [Colletotrichum chlorophyti]|uniref:Alkali-sensitive linkage protein 1-like protein 2 n=1 Tax=Colletotrichum chlorophyti TaxID=708187 RepID=A0A1Q8S1W7_9PEZI|nr:Alkali-sensitive linkage protein 1-like protein 2 [Colletotrichum chlorophyti]
MYTKKALSVVASLALAEQALGFNTHRHAQAHVDKQRDVHVEWEIVTHYVYVTVTEGEPVPTSTPTPSQPAAPEYQYSSSSRPTVTSTSVIVVPTPTPTPAPVAAAPSTTLATSVKASQAPVIQQAQVAVASSSKPTASSSAVSASALGSKRGIAYNSASLANAFFTSGTSDCSWAYNWDSLDNGLTSGPQFVPMLWGPVETHTNRWQQNADASIAKGSTHILSFNECDNAGQCNLDAASAAAAHVKWLNPFASQVKIGSPAITNSNIAGEGLDWLKAWVSACDTAGCAYDFCVTHWYSPANAAQTLFDHLQSVHEICGGKPVWLTEFAPLGSDAEALSFVQTNIPKLDEVEYLERYSYFMAKDGVLNSGTGLSALGQAYVSA